MGVLRFRLFGVPTEIQPGFWLLPLYLGSRFDPSVGGVLAILGVVLISILVHELGHAATARWFGCNPRIALHMLGGTTSWQPTPTLGRKRHAIVSLAGPVAGFALGAAAFVIYLALAGEVRVTEGGAPARSLLSRGLEALVWVNFVWGAINLLPVLPFDGGQVLAATLGPKRRRLTAVLSLAFGVTIGVAMLSIGWILGAALFFIGGIANFVASERRGTRTVHPEALRAALQRARGAMDSEDYDQAAAIARAVLEASTERSARAEAFDVLVWSLLLAGNVESAHAALRRLPPGIPVDPFLRGAVHDAIGDAATAADLLISARSSGDERPDLAALLIKALLGAGRFAAAASVTTDIIEDASEEEVRRVGREVLDGGAPVSAACLFGELFQRTEDPADAYDAARGFARGGKAEEALSALGDALRAGHPDPSRARADEDLALLHGDERFEALMGGAAPGAG